MAKLSKREQVAKKLGGTLNYTTGKVAAKPVAKPIFNVPVKKVEPRLDFANGESIKAKNVVSVEDMLNPQSKINAKLKAQSLKTEAKNAVPTALTNQINALSPQKRSVKIPDAPQGVLAKLIYNVSNQQKVQPPTPTKTGQKAIDTTKGIAKTVKEHIGSSMRAFIANPIETVAKSLTPKMQLNNPKLADGKVQWEKPTEKGTLAEAFPQIGVGGFAGSVKNVSKSIVEGIAKETNPAVIKNILTKSGIAHDTALLDTLSKTTKPAAVEKILKPSIQKEVVQGLDNRIKNTPYTADTAHHVEQLKSLREAAIHPRADVAELKGIQKQGDVLANDFVQKRASVLSPIIKNEQKQYAIGQAAKDSKNIPEFISNIEKKHGPVQNIFKSQQDMTQFFNKAKSTQAKTPGFIDKLKGHFSQKQMKGSVINPFAPKSPLHVEAKKYKTPEEFVNKQSIIYHGTPEKFTKFNTKKSYDASTWFTANKDEILSNEVGAVQGPGQKLNIMERYIKPDVKLATPEMSDNLLTDQLIQEGYRGVKYPVGDYGDYEWTKLWFPNEDTLTKSQLTNIWKEANKPSIFTKKEKGFVANPFAPKPKDDVTKYIAEQTQKRELARDPQGFSLGKLYKEIKSKLVDSNAPIEDVLRTAQKKGRFEVLPAHDISGQIDRVLRAPTLAGQFARENGLESIIKKHKGNIEELDQYLIARHSKTLEAKGIQTGRNSEMDAKLLEQLGPKYDKVAKEVNAYSQKLLDYSVDSGLISKETATKLKTMYPDYVPMNRVFGELEKSGQFGTKAVASLSKQTVVQGIKGSAREVESPLASLLSKTADAFAQGEKNKAAKMLASYEKLPGNPFGLRLIKEGEKTGGLHTISFLDNGVKKTYEVLPEIEQAAKAMSVQQMNILGKIFSLPVRLAKLGITGINPAFVMANVAKDNVFAFVTSKHGIKTSLANPVVFAQSLFNALGHGKLYQEMVRSGAGGTSFDIVRNQGMKTITQMRGLSAPGVVNKIKYVVDTPARLLHAIEDIVGRGEEMTRLQQFAGTKTALLKAGRTAEDARLLAAKAARENTANFARRGEWGTVLNSAFMYLNASIQGSRTFVRSMERNPVSTTAKLTTVLFLPVATITAYNLNDEKRRQVYEDLPDYEKQNNLILIPDNVTKDEKGKYNVIKIPLPPGLSSLSDVVRRAVEQAHGLDPVTFSEIAKDLIGSVSPITPETNSVLSTLTPQAVKPSLEASLNKNIFTGSPQVPRSLEGLPPEAQTKPGISAVSNILGKKLGVSPIKIEEWVKGTFGGTGLNVLNSIDKGLAKTGKIKDEEIGGQSFIQSITARFGKAAGGEENRKLWDIQAKQKEQELLKSKQEKEAFMPQYNAVQDAKKAGNEDKAQELVDKMTDEEYKTYVKIRQSERTKNSQTVKALINSNPKKAVQYVRSLPEYEQQRIIDNLSDAEYTVYSLGK